MRAGWKDTDVETITENLVGRGGQNNNREKRPELKK